RQRLESQVHPRNVAIGDPHMVLLQIRLIPKRLQYYWPSGYQRTLSPKANQTPKEGGRSGPPPVPAVLSLAQQLQHRLRRQVSLRQHSRRRLLQNLVLRERHHLVCHVNVTDTRLRSLQVLDRDAQVGNRMLEAVLVSTKLRPLVRHLLDRLVDSRDGGIGRGLARNGKTRNAKCGSVHAGNGKIDILTLIGPDMERQTVRGQASVE